MKLLHFPKPEDPGPDTPAPAVRLTRDELVEANLNLVDPIARSLVRKMPSSIELDDLVQAGRIGLLDAADRYQPAKGGFEPFAKKRIRGAILDSVRRREWQEANHDELTAPDELLASPGHAPEADKVVEIGQLRNRFNAIVSELDEREQTVIRGMYILEQTHAKIGEQLNICSSRVSQIHRGIINRVRRDPVHFRKAA